MNQIELDTEVELKWIHNNQIMISEIAINEYQVIGYSIIKNPAINDDQMLFLQEFLLP